MTLTHEDFEAFFNETDLKPVYRKDNIELWDEVYSLLSYKPVDYLGLNIDYQLEYINQNYDDLIDLSCIVFFNNDPVAIWPFTIGHKAGDIHLSSQGENILPPLYINGCSQKIIKKCNLQIFNLCENMNKKISKIFWVTTSPFSNNSFISNWQLLCISNKSKASVIYNLYVDLSKDLDEIKSNFRRRYKTLINKGEALWDIQVHHESIDIEIWNQFKLLHFNAAGRLTRSEKSWDIQYNNIRKNNAFLITLKDQDTMVGGALFTYSDDEGRYDVGAYDRNLFDKPIGHIAQSVAISELKNKGLLFYKIGRRFYEIDDPMPTDKELSIANFKEGFASFSLPEYILKNYTD